MYESVKEDPTALRPAPGEQLPPAAAATSPALALEPPRPPLSPVRLLLALVLLVGVAVGGLLGVRHVRASRAAVAAALPPSFAPYVDATLTPTYQFQDPSASPARDVVLGFVVSAPSAPCTPSWGAAYTLDEAATAIDLDRRIAQAQAEGGNVIASFGGAANSELAVGCTSSASLAAAYGTVIQRYRLTTIDLDVEGAALAAVGADARRAEAIAAVQRLLAASRGHLGVWLTLPVAPDGLTPDGVAAVRAMLAAHVVLAGVNVLAMDYGPGREVGRDLLPTIERSAAAARAQTARAYAAAGVPLGSAAGWNRIGVTVMIGQNDVPGEQFTVADASGLARYALARGIARVSMWSANRDAPCTAYPGVAVLSNTCSGVAQAPLEFSRVLDRLATAASAGAPTVIGSASAPASPPVDDPATSPYPIWSPAQAYETAYKVVWHHDVYEAKWFSQGQAPDQPVPSGAPSPWSLLGPVLPGEHQPALVRLNRGTFPAWSATTVYRGGARVLYHGLPYAAKWYTRGDVPDGSLANLQQSPWVPLYAYAGEPR